VSVLVSSVPSAPLRARSDPSHVRRHAGHCDCRRCCATAALPPGSACGRTPRMFDACCRRADDSASAFGRARACAVARAVCADARCWIVVHRPCVMTVVFFGAGAETGAAIHGNGSHRWGVQASVARGLQGQVGRAALLSARLYLCLPDRGAAGCREDRGMHSPQSAADYCILRPGCRVCGAGRRGVGHFGRLALFPFGMDADAAQGAILWKLRGWRSPVVPRSKAVWVR
jgi:hypothetical protein